MKLAEIIVFKAPSVPGRSMSWGCKERVLNECAGNFPPQVICMDFNLCDLIGVALDELHSR